MTIALLPRRLRMSLSVLALLTLGACTQYQYVPPPTAEGRSCVAQCTMMRSQCQTQANSQLQQCNMMRSAALSSYNRCRAAGGGNSCVQPPSCTGGSYQCSGPYDDCFRACGGQILPMN